MFMMLFNSATQYANGILKNHVLCILSHRLMFVATNCVAELILCNRSQGAFTYVKKIIVPGLTRHSGGGQAEAGMTQKG
jgi:hypothetical protein